MGVVQTFKLIKLYASDVRSSLCISYTSVKLLKKKKQYETLSQGFW